MDRDDGERQDMTIGTKIKGLLRRSPVARRAAAKMRATIESDRLAGHEAHLLAHDQAIGDLFPALQQVQGPILSSIEERLRLIETNLPELLNTIASANGERRLLRRTMNESQAELWTRIEMIRRELMFELRYGNDRQSPMPIEPKVVDEEKFAEARDHGLRVNLGCGHLALDGYLNVDVRDLPGVDVIASVDRLPFERNELEEVFSAHLVEHFPQERLERELLPYWISLLRPGGLFRAVVPDIGAMITGYTEGTATYAELREVVFGGQEYEGDFHFNMYTVESFSELLTAAGMVTIEVEDEALRNGACFEFQIVARKPE
jgi:predicted SAM-dependent methyltransferase